MISFLKRLCLFVVGDINWNPPCQMSILDWLLGLTPSQQVICQTYLFLFPLPPPLQSAVCTLQTWKQEHRGGGANDAMTWKWMKMAPFGAKNLYSRVSVSTSMIGKSKGIWIFPKIVVPPKSSVLIRVFHYKLINHPFWGTPIFGKTHICGLDLCHAFIFSFFFSCFLPGLSTCQPKKKVKSFAAVWQYLKMLDSRGNTRTGGQHNCLEDSYINRNLSSKNG